MTDSFNDGLGRRRRGRADQRAAVVGHRAFHYNRAIIIWRIRIDRGIILPHPDHIITAPLLYGESV